MSYYSKIDVLRKEMYQALTDKVLMSFEDLDNMHSDQELEDYFYDLPQSTYFTKHCVGLPVYILSYTNGVFTCYDNEDGKCYEIEQEYVGAESIALFLDIEPLNYISHE